VNTKFFRFLFLVAILGGALSLPTSQAEADALDNWTTNQVSTNYFGLNCVVYRNGRYVAYGEYSDYGVIMTSEDGRHWTLRSDGGGPTGSGLSYSVALVYTGGRFFALGGFGESGMSTNGIDWTIFGGPGAWTSGVTYGDSKYIAVGSDYWLSTTDLNVFTSVDGTNWTAQHSTSPGGAALSDIAYGAGTFVAKGSAFGGYVNDSGHIYTSTNGTNWTQRGIAGGSTISFLNGIFIVPSSPGTNLLSADGINWTAKSTGITNVLGKVGAANRVFMARAGSYLATSTDGTNWVQHAPMLPGTSGVASDGSRLVTVGCTLVLPGFNYNSYACLSDVLVGIRMTNAIAPQIVLSGLIGRSCQIESLDALTGPSTNNWQTLATLQLPTYPYAWTDTTATNSQRFYRAALLP